MIHLRLRSFEKARNQCTNKNNNAKSFSHFLCRFSFLSLCYQISWCESLLNCYTWATLSFGNKHCLILTEWKFSYYCRSHGVFKLWFGSETMQSRFHIIYLQVDIDHWHVQFNSWLYWTSMLIVSSYGSHSDW